MQRQVVAFGQQLFEGHKVDLMPMNEFQIRVRCVSEEAHPEAHGPHGDRLANMSTSGDAEHTAAQGHGALRGPLSHLHIPTLGDQTLRQGQEKCQGVLSDAVAIGSRRRGHCDAVPGGCFQIDRIKADAGACNNS